MMLDRTLLDVARWHRRSWLVTAGLQLAIGASYLPQAWFLAHALAAVVSGDRRGAVTAALAVTALVAARWLLVAGQARAAARLGGAVRVDLRDRALAGALVPAALHDPARRDGALRATLVEGVDGVDAYVTRYLPALAQVLVLAPVVVVLLVLVHPLAGLLVGIALLAAVLGPLGWKRLMARRSLDHWDSYEALGSDLLEALRGVTTLRVLGAVGATRARIAARTAALHRATVRVMRVSLLDTALIDLAVQGGSLAAVVVAVVDGGTPASTYLVLLLAGEAFRPVRELSRAWHAGYLGTSATAGLRALGADAAPPRPGADDLPVLAPRPSALVLEDVAFAYTAGAPVLDGVDARFERGTVTALVGPSGAGKSTLLDLVLGHLAPDRGRVHCDGRPVRAADVAVVTQRPLLFEGTVRDNVAAGRPDATEAEVLRACADAGILAEVQAMPQGIDTPVAAAGANVSGGQRQRLALARAIVADRPVVLADEPTSALDAVSAATVTATLARLAQDRIVVVVAHREESLDGVDRVLELHDGRLRPALGAAR